MPLPDKDNMQDQSETGAANRGARSTWIFTLVIVRMLMTVASLAHDNSVRAHVIPVVHIAAQLNGARWCHYML